MSPQEAFWRRYSMEVGMHSEPQDDDGLRDDMSGGERRARRGGRRDSKSSSSLVVIVGAGLAAAVIVGYAAYMHIAGASGRAARASVEGAEKALLAGEFGQARKLAADGKRTLSEAGDRIARPDRKELKLRAGKVEDALGVLDEAKKALSEAAEAPVEKRTHIEDLVRSASQNYPKQKKLHKELSQLAREALRVEREAGREEIAAKLKAVREKIRSQPLGEVGAEIEEAERTLDKYSRALPDEEKAKQREEIERLRGISDLADEAKRAVDGLDNQPKERRKRLAVIVPRLGGEDEESKAVKRRIAELAEEAEKQAEAEHIKEAKDVAKTLRYVGGQDDRITYDLKKIDIEKKIIPLDVLGRQVDFVADATLGRWTMKIGERSFYVSSRRAPVPTANLVWLAVSCAEGLEGLPGSPKGEWQLITFSPMPVASQGGDGGVQRYYLDGKIYDTVNRFDRNDAVSRARDFLGAAQALHRAVANDTWAGEDLRRVVAYMVGATYRQQQRGDFITVPFIRGAVMLGYVEDSMPGAGERLKEQIENYRAAYRKLVDPIKLRTGVAPDGSKLTVSVTSEFPFERVEWRVYDMAANRTSFYLSHPMRKQTSYYVKAQFPGEKADWQPGETPERIGMSHRSVGVVSSYATAKGTYRVDADRWATSARCEYNPNRPAYHGRPEWHWPPHVLLLDADSRMLGVVTDAGRLDMPGLFTKIEDKAERRKAHESFLDRCAKTLRSPGELYLLYKYFVQYALDSPLVDTHPDLLGSSQHSGDIHQDYHQFLNRQVGGLFVGDCDDVAELYQNIVKRQGRLAFVLDVPGHATCGWVEKDQDVSLFKRGAFSKEAERLVAPYTFDFLDTGMPRRFTNAELDKLIESGVKSYDENNQVVFNPNDVVFLFRFAGEQTRTPYVLGTQMFVDPAYAETLRTVQGHWHFHFYSLGVETMVKLLETDKASRNCFELAGLYRAVCEADKAIKWHRTGMSRLPADNLSSRVGTFRRMASIYKMDLRPEEAKKVVDEAGAVIESFEKKSGRRETEQRFQVAGVAAAVGRPWTAYKLVGEDLQRLGGGRRLGRSEGQVLASIYRFMKEEMDSGSRKLTDDEKHAYNEVGRMLKEFIDSKLWESTDGFTSSMMKYATLASYYAGKYGAGRLREELLKDGPYPARGRRHFLRAGASEEEDWAWIRVSMLVYHVEIAQLLDEDEPDRVDPGLAAKLVDSMERASRETRKHGSLSSMEHLLVVQRLTRAGIRGKVEEFEPLLKEVGKRNWGRLYQQSSEAVGGIARFMKAGDFEKLLELFGKYVDPRPHHFNIVYSAYRTRAYERARAASKAALRKFPGDKDMKREAEYLEQLIKHRLEERKKRDQKTTRRTRGVRLRPAA